MDEIPKPTTGPCSSSPLSLPALPSERVVLLWQKSLKLTTFGSFLPLLRLSLVCLEGLFTLLKVCFRL